MKKYKNFTLHEYLKALSKKTPTPGGGSASAMNGALAASLLSMVAEYSMNKGKSRSIENKIKKIAKLSKANMNEFLDYVDLDAEAYLGVVRARKKTLVEQKKAKTQARLIPERIGKLCYKTILLTPALIEHGNPYLLSDVKVAVEMLVAAYNGAHINAEINR